MTKKLLKIGSDALEKGSSHGIFQDLNKPYQAILWKET